MKVGDLVKVRRADSQPNKFSRIVTPEDLGIIISDEDLAKLSTEPSSTKYFWVMLNKSYYNKTIWSYREFELELISEL